MEISRREFLAGSTAVALSSSSMASGLFHDAPTLKVGLIGCGGRGSGALRNTLEAEKGVVVHALGDLFADRANGTANGVKKDLPDRCAFGDRVFTGFDAYQKVIDSGVDLVIIATPPGFRPTFFEAAVKAGKHVFMEKPVAVDGPGIRRVIAAAGEAKAKKLTVVAGTQRRHDLGYQETIDRIHKGQIGDVVSMICYWNQGGLWSVEKQQGWSDMEHQIRNWLYYTWLSGDHIVEQHVHNLDVCNWVMQGHPVKCFSMGGRATRVEPVFGHIFDHFATEYEYANGTKMMSYCRQIDGCATRVSEEIYGSNGKSNPGGSISGRKAWKYEGKRPNPYVNEHVRLYKSIRANEGFNEGVQVAESTLTAIMGRMSAYSGEEITWEQALNSTVVYGPAHLEFGDVPVPAVAIPGKTKGVY